MNTLEILLGQIPEAVYFALFIILTKQLKEKRALFITISCVDYVLLFKTMVHSIYAHVGFFILTFLLLKILYKERAQITDVFTLAIASVTLIIFNLIISPLFSVNYIVSVILIRIMMVVFLFTFRNKLPKVQALYKRMWNRKKHPDTKMKSLTFRSINLVIFNIMFYVINIGMMLAACTMIVN